MLKIAGVINEINKYIRRKKGIGTLTSRISMKRQFKIIKKNFVMETFSRTQKNKNNTRLTNRKNQRPSNLY